MFSCSISGKIPHEPVVSIKSGHVFERKLILSLINQNGICPITEQILTIQDLIAVQVSEIVQPRPPSATSISSLLRHLQNEWDASLLETFKLRKHITQIRQELSHALYQHDAACRVIARITQERDKARSELVETRKNMAAVLTQTNFRTIDAVNLEGIDEKITEKITKKADELQRWRKNRPKKTENLSTKQQLRTMKEISSNILHSPSSPGILSVSLNTNDKDLIFTGGNDGQIINWNTRTKKVENILKGHKKKILALKCSNKQPILLSGSADKTIGLWTQKNSTWALTKQITYPEGPVNDLDIHPLGDYFVSGQDDQTWAFSSLTQGRVIQSVIVDKCNRVNACKLHPDGRLLCTGDDAHNVRIWEVHNQKTLINLERAQAEITSLSFSENGYHLAASSKDGVVRIYDLRKVSILHSWKAKDSTISCVKYDQSGHYLVMAGNDIRIYQSKLWKKPLLTLTNHSKEVTDVCWGINANYLVSVSKDRLLKIYATL